jgi:hypothetical protein
MTTSQLYNRTSRVRQLLSASVLLFSTGLMSAEINTVLDHNDTESASPGFRFKAAPPPAKNDAATKAAFTLLIGRRDPNGGTLEKVHDGRVPLDEDQPSENFFFSAGTEGGWLLVDLGAIIKVQQVNTYSWHPNARGPQVYTLYASDGKASDFNSQPEPGTNLEKGAWKLIAKVDTRPNEGEGGGQYAVSIVSSNSAIGRYRYLLFVISRTENRDPFGNTFYSEIDVIDSKAPAPEPVDEPKIQIIRETIVFGDGKYRVILDTSETPDLTEWTRQNISPMVKEWYPKLVDLLPSEGYQAPTNFNVVFDRDMRGVAATSGRQIRCDEPCRDIVIGLLNLGITDASIRLTGTFVVAVPIHHVKDVYWGSCRGPPPGSAPKISCDHWYQTVRHCLITVDAVGQGC